MRIKFQAAYLVAVADPSSVAGRPGLIDQAQFMNSKQEIVDACQSLLNPDASQQQVIAIFIDCKVTVISKYPQEHIVSFSETSYPLCYVFNILN